MIDKRILKLREIEYWNMVKKQGKQLMKIFEHYGGCEHCEHSLCCKINPPVVKNNEVTRIANHIKMNKNDFIEKYLLDYTIPDFLPGETINDFLINEIPCPFLDNNKCSIYPVRPAACKWFPFQPAWKIITLEGIDICPTATLISSNVWEYQQKLLKEMTKDEIEKMEEEASKKRKRRKKFEDNILNPLDKIYNQLNITDIAMQNYMENYDSEFFTDCMLYYKRI